jgi:hypothetical protein
MAKKTISIVTPDEKTELASFELVDGTLIADWKNEAYQLEIELSGIADRKGKVLYPKDGLAFFEALDAAYATSSFISVAKS